MWMLVLVLAAFHLMRIDGTWKITGGSYAVERTGCAPSPRATATTTDGTPDELQTSRYDDSLEHAGLPFSLDREH